MTAPQFAKGVRVEGQEAGQKAFSLSNADLSRVLQASAVRGASQISLNSGGWFDDFQEGSDLPPIASLVAKSASAMKSALFPPSRARSIVPGSPKCRVSFKTNDGNVESTVPPLHSPPAPPSASTAARAKSTLSFSLNHSILLSDRRRHLSSLNAALPPLSRASQSVETADELEARRMADVVCDNLMIRLPSATKSTIDVSVKSPRSAKSRRRSVLSMNINLNLPSVHGPMSSDVKSFTSKSPPVPAASVDLEQGEIAAELERLPSNQQKKAPRRAKSATVLTVSLPHDEAREREGLKNPPELQQAGWIPLPLPLPPLDPSASRLKSQLVASSSRAPVISYSSALSTIEASIKELRSMSRALGECNEALNAQSSKVAAHTHRLESRRHKTEASSSLGSSNSLREESSPVPESHSTLWSYLQKRGSELSQETDAPSASRALLMLPDATMTSSSAPTATSKRPSMIGGVAIPAAPGGIKHTASYVARIGPNSSIRDSSSSMQTRNKNPPSLEPHRPKPAGPSSSANGGSSSSSDDV